MKLTIPRKEFHDALQTVSRAVASITTLPVLKSVLLDLQDDTLRLFATDLEIGVEVRLSARADQSGKAAVPAKTLQEIIAALPEADVTLATASDSEHAVTVTCRKSVYRINTLDAEDFPAMSPVTEGDVLTVAQPLLKDMIRQTIIAASEDDTRPVLTGISVKVEGGRLTLAATDTHRLAVRAAILSGSSAERAVIVPQRTLAELMRSLGDDPETTVELRLDQTQAVFCTDRVTLTSRLIEGQFPKYERVIPSGYTRKLTIPREELLSCLRRARIVARDAAAKDRVVLSATSGGLVGQSLEITAEGELGQCREDVEIVLEGTGVALAANVHYLMEGLGVLGSAGVNLELTEPLSPMVLRPVDGADFLMVIMPMQVQ